MRCYLSHGQGFSEMFADKIQPMANSSVESSGLTMGVGQIAPQQDFFQCVHGQGLSKSICTGIELQHIAESLCDAGLLLVLVQV